MKEKVLLARNVATRLYAAENAVDAAIVEVTALMAAMVQTRRDLELSATVGAEALSSIGDAVTALNQARAATVEGHHELAKVQDALRIPAAAMSPSFKPWFLEHRRQAG